MICNLKKKKYGLYFQGCYKSSGIKLNENLYANLHKQLFMEHTHFVFNSQKTM